MSCWGGGERQGEGLGVQGGGDAGLTQAAVTHEALDDGTLAAQVLRHRGAAHLQVTHLGTGKNTHQ